MCRNQNVVLENEHNSPLLKLKFNQYSKYEMHASNQSNSSMVKLVLGTIKHLFMMLLWLNK